MPGSSGQSQPVASSSLLGLANTSEADSATATPVNGKSEGTVYFECENCKRQVSLLDLDAFMLLTVSQIASNRYAPHLSSCLGLGNSRRGAVRNATSKTKCVYRHSRRNALLIRSRLASEAGRSTSPYVGSDAGNVSDDGKPGLKTKTKLSKAKRQGKQS